MLDLLIHSGQLIDGTGNPWQRADIGIVGDRIASVGALRHEPAKRSIDASGLFLAPGFVDMHAHSDVQLLAQPAWEVKLAQGVTVEVIGQDGLGVAPLTDGIVAPLRQQLRAWNGEPPVVDWGWRSMAD